MGGGHWKLSEIALCYSLGLHQRNGKQHGDLASCLKNRTGVYIVLQWRSAANSQKIQYCKMRFMLEVRTNAIQEHTVYTVFKGTPCHSIETILEELFEFLPGKQEHK